MKLKIRLACLSSAALIALCASAAYADDAKPTPPPATDNQNSGANEILVTARKTKETIQDAPLAVSVITGALLEKTNFSQLSDVARFVPGLALVPLNTARDTGSEIRGISTFSFSDAFESSVSTVVDGVVLGREAQGFSDFLDIKSVEVIKGPQGTLYGKNASAGVISVQTNDPESKFGARADATYGSYNEVKLRGTVTGPVSDTVAFRFTGTFNRRDGVLNNAIAGQPAVNDRNTYQLRGKLLWQPNSDLSIKLTGDYEHEHDHCCLPTFLVAGAPSAAITFFAANPGVLQLQTALAAVGIVPGPNNRSVAVLQSRIGQFASSGGLALNIDYKLGDTTLSSITAWRKWNINEFNEADGVSNSNVNDHNGTIDKTEQFTQELRINGKVGSQLDYVGGLFFFHQSLAAYGTVDINLALNAPPAFGIPNFNVRTLANRTANSDSYAAYGETTFHVTDKGSLIVGARYTHDRIDATYNRTSTALTPTLPFSPFFGANVVGAQVVNQDNLSGRIIGRYFWTPEIMTYASWSRGYKAPGIDVSESVNVAQIQTPGGLPVLPSEIPTLWEAGIRTQLFDRALTTNVTVYAENLRDLQTITTTATGVTENLSINKIRSKGVEVEAILRPRALPGLTLSGTFDLNDIHIISFVANPILNGATLPNNPRYFYSVVGDYRAKLGGSDYEGFLRAEWTHQSSKNTALNGNALDQIGAYGLLNLRVGFNAPDNRYGVTFAVENATNTVYDLYKLPSSYSALDGATAAQYIGDTRTWTVTFHGKF